jgi:hypothetical protein
MKKVQISKGMRLFWAASFVVGLVALGVGVVFLVSGPEMIVPTVVFGVPGAFLAVESFGRMMGWEK